MHIQRLWLCLLENAQAAQCVTSQLVFDRLMRLCSHFRPCSRPFDQSHRLQQKRPPPTSTLVWM